MPRTVVFGAHGQVGRALLRHLAAQKSPAMGLDRDDADLSQPTSIAPLLDKLHSEQPLKGVLNTAAYTAVDLAEKETALAQILNAQVPGEMARWCSRHGIPFVHYSTDYVYDGAGTRPWSEDAPPAPLSAYGRTKLEGDQAVIAAGGKYLIFRTTWVYDDQGKNFLLTMLKLGKDREELKVVADQHGAPTYADHLAQATLRGLKRAESMPQFPSGIYHLSNSGETTWHGFASAIFEAARAQGRELKVRSVQAIPSSEYPTPARRPLNSRLNLAKAREILGLEMPDWRQGLKDCMEILK